MARYWINLGMQQDAPKELEELANHHGEFEMSYVTEDLEDAKEALARAQQLRGENWLGGQIVRQPECPKCGSFGRFRDTYCPKCGSELSEKEYM